ncbi:MAG: glycosyltransferase [Acidimicrobiales bacterium]
MAETDRTPAADEARPDGIVAFACCRLVVPQPGPQRVPDHAAARGRDAGAVGQQHRHANPAPGKTEVPFRKYARKIKSTLNGLRRDESGMWVLSPLFVPRYTERGLRANGRLLERQVRLACRRIGIRRPAVWITVPTAADGIADEWRPVVFNRSDEFSAFPEVDRELIAGLERRLLDRSDHVFYVNHELMAREEEATADAEYLGHGVDYEHFSQGDAMPEPAVLRDLPRPLIGFYGALDDYTIDLDLLIATARANPAATLLVIGPQQMALDRLTAEPNVTYLGPIPYEELPAYAARFDVGLMPWLDNEWIRRCNPIKLKEYLAVGFPVATTDFPELAPFRDLVHVGAGPEGFAAAVAAALADPSTSTSRRSAVRDSSWDAIATRAAQQLGVG